MLVRNTSPQARIVTVFVAKRERPIELVLGRPGARVEWDRMDEKARIGTPPDAEVIDVEAIALREGVTSEALVKALHADVTYQTWRAEGYIAEA